MIFLVPKGGIMSWSWLPATGRVTISEPQDQCLPLTTWHGPGCRPLESRQEKVAEHHFGAVKAPFRGTPSIKDAVLGTHLHHLQQISELAVNQRPFCAG